MPDVTEIIEELESYGVPNARAHLLAAKLIIIGEEAAPYRRETVGVVADLEIERRRNLENTTQMPRSHIGFAAKFRGPR